MYTETNGKRRNKIESTDRLNSGNFTLFLNHQLRSTTVMIGNDPSEKNGTKTEMKENKIEIKKEVREIIMTKNKQKEIPFFIQGTFVPCFIRIISFCEYAEYDEYASLCHH